MKHVILTTGYSGFDLESFLLKLRHAHANMVVDVRHKPVSRKKGFSARGLQPFLEKNGISYVQFGELGVPDWLRKDLKEGECSLEQYFISFRCFLAKRRDALSRLYALVTRNTCCLMCLEADAAKCHRSVIANELCRLNGETIEVEHI